LALEAASVTRRGKVCARNQDAGPGSCWWWWEGCPDKVALCDIRHQRGAIARLNAPTEGLDLRAWLIELDRQLAVMRPSTPCYQRFEAHAHKLTVAEIRATHDQASLCEVERRLRAARHPTGHHFHDLDRVWPRAELCALIVEATNRNRQLLAELMGREVREAGPRFDPRLIPDARLDVLIQRHRDMIVVDACRAERARRAQAVAA
jgi:hypothetical protein